MVKYSQQQQDKNRPHNSLRCVFSVFRCVFFVFFTYSLQAFTSGFLNTGRGHLNMNPALRESCI
jgi:hypothetical protein